MLYSMREALLSHRGRASSFYAFKFLAVGIAVPFLPLWLKSQGLSDSDVGFVNSAPIWMMVLINIFVGRIADKASDWRQVIIAASLLSGFASITLFFAQGFWAILFCWTLTVLPFMVGAPVTDAATVRMARRRNLDFAMIRVWGTVGYVAANLFSGWMLNLSGVGIFLPLFVSFCLIRGLMSLQLPKFRSEAPEDEKLGPEVVVAPPHPLQAQEIKDAFRPWFALAILGSAFIVASHGPLYAFGSILWDRAGLPSTIIGPLWAIGSAAEILTFFVFARIAKRFSARHLLIFAAGITVLRWVGMSFDVPVWGFFLLQMLHAVSFGITYLGTLNFVANWTAEKFAAEAQSLVQVVSQATLATFIVLFGFVFSNFGAPTFMLSAILAGLGGALIFVSLVLVNPRSEA
ncbi:PPP family 3-phenylpropionic acid transporter [Maritalea mobilis]|uniref:PPP family 3-phenylpropionic acid transporter n=1 Tax=Maritalea mobilis TaxID=483324 RepID=A0A4R6VVD5_9HYPH|nr:MFS transporter [Maritalea mobilis]TDQ66716.1 PPP family 3-phenylpropionic acid transporter [Maritalea mobilis]